MLRTSPIKIVSKFPRRFFSSQVIKCDAVVLGGGIGGASTSFQLSKLHNLDVVCLERADSPGYGATGQAYGLYSANHAPSVTNKLLSLYSKSFFQSPDIECIDDSVEDMNILEKTGLIALSSPESYNYLYKLFGPQDSLKFNESIKVLPQADLINYSSFIKTNELAPYAIYDNDVYNFDVGLVYEHFLIGGNRLGVNYQFNQTAVEITKCANGNWEIASFNAETNNIDRFETSILVNACGEWTDEIAIKAGIKPINIQTSKRTVIVFSFEPNIDNNNNDQLPPWLGWISPNLQKTFYSCFQGNSGIFLYERYDKDNEESEDEDEDEDEIEICLHKIHKYTNLKVKKISCKSAGIKCSVQQDKNIVVGPDVDDDSFIWIAGLSSYGIQTSPAYSKIAACLATKNKLPSDMIDLGINVNELLPSRLLHKMKQTQ